MLRAIHTATAGNSLYTSNPIISNIIYNWLTHTKLGTFTTGIVCCATHAENPFFQTQNHHSFCILYLPDRGISFHQSLFSVYTADLKCLSGTVEGSQQQSLSLDINALYMFTAHLDFEVLDQRMGALKVWFMHYLCTLVTLVYDKNDNFLNKLSNPSFSEAGCLSHKEFI